MLCVRTNFSNIKISTMKNKKYQSFLQAIILSVILSFFKI